MRIITSVHNDEIKAVAALHRAKDRYEQGRFIAEGERTVATFIHAGWKPMVVYVTERTIGLASGYGVDISITVVSESVMKKISYAATPSHIVALFAIPERPAMSSLSAGLVMAQLADPGNVGTLIRTCAALDKRCVVMVEGVDPWHPKVIQASAGTIATVTVFSVSWDELIAHRGSLALYALVVQGGKKIDTVEARNALLVVGNEAHGIPASWIAQCTENITLPMPGNTESLNVAVAGSIALYTLFVP